MAHEKQMGLRPCGVPPQAKEKVRRGVTHVRKAAGDLSSAAGAMADEYRARGKEVWWGHSLHRIRGFQNDGKQYVCANPAKAVPTALGVGFVLGLIFRNILSPVKRGQLNSFNLSKCGWSLGSVSAVDSGGAYDLITHAHRDYGKRFIDVV